MLSIAERHKYIQEKLSEDGYVKVLDLAKDLDVTVVTIRKDLKMLEEKGVLYKTHGSASPRNPHAADQTVFEKEKIKATEKKRIGEAAAAMLTENDFIIVNSGSTALAFVEQIVPQGKLTVVTASLQLCLALGELESVDILQIGGLYQRQSMSVLGNYALSLFENINCTKVFLGVDGIDVEVGLTTTNMQEAELNRMMIDSALKTIILCDSSKFGKKGFGKICAIDKVDVIITDSGISQSMKRMIDELGVELIIV